MKWLRTLVLFDSGDIASTLDWKLIHESYVRSIQSIDFPEGQGTLTLRRKFRRPDGQWSRNGVKFLKSRFFSHMVNDERWRAEEKFDLGNQGGAPVIKLYPGFASYQEPIESNFGGFDFVISGPDGVHVAIEWETGNISSSHRSVNKLAIALAAGRIQAGILIVPSRDLYEHLTDRIGNIKELSGYIRMWKDLEPRVERGLLAFTIVEHDFLTDDPSFPYLPVGNDGNSRSGKSRQR